MFIKLINGHTSLFASDKQCENVSILVPAAYLHVLHVGVILGRHVDRTLQKQGLSRGRFILLSLLRSQGGSVPVCRLARMASVTATTVSSVLNRMVRDGLVQRGADPSDKRIVLVGMRPKGQRVLDEVFPSLFAHEATAMSKLDSDELRTLIELLSKVSFHIPRTPNLK